MLGLFTPEARQRLFGPATEKVSLEDRFVERSDEKPPSLSLSEEMLQFGRKIFSQGKYQTKGHFEALVKDHLQLSRQDHARLQQDIVLEPSLRKFERDGRFKHVFLYQEQVTRCIKDLRVNVRPLFSAYESQGSMMSDLKELGSQLGLQFLAVPPTKPASIGPRQVVDRFQYQEDLGGILKLPEMADPLDGLVCVNEEDAAVVELARQSNLGIMENYRSRCVDIVVKLFDISAAHVARMDDCLNLFFDMYGHVDGCLADLVRTKVASLFKSEVRSSLLSSVREDDTARQATDNAGLMGGELKIKSSIGDAVKVDEILSKALARKETPSARGRSRWSRGDKVDFSRKRKRSASPRYRNRSRSRDGKPSGSSPSVIFSLSSVSEGQRKKKTKRQRGKGSGASRGKGRTSKPGAKEPSSRSEYFTPDSFSSALASGFFSSEAKALISSKGFQFESISILSQLHLGGRIRFARPAWRQATNNPWVHRVLEHGYLCPFKHEVRQTRVPASPSMPQDAKDVLAAEMEMLLSKQAVAPAVAQLDQFVSTFFAVPKSTVGKWRSILNLKYFNRRVKGYKFRMEGFKIVRDWIQPGFFMVTLDLKDQFWSVPVHETMFRFLRFFWNGQLFQWKVLPMGLKCSPRVVKKLLQPVMAFLRSSFGIMISIYMDDMILQGKTPEEVFLHAQITALVLLCLGWEVSWSKSTFVPNQVSKHLGFIIDSRRMVASCPEDKIQKIVAAASVVRDQGWVSVHEAERLLGRMESVRPVTPLAALHYRYFQAQLLQAIRGGRRPTKEFFLTGGSRKDLEWWISSAGFRANSESPLREPSPSLDIWSDASKFGGAGAHNSRGELFHRAWTQDELDRDLHINLLEVRAATEAVQNLAKEGDLIRLHVDNTTACAYLKRQGGTRSWSLCQEACQAWSAALSVGATLLTPHWISAKDNTGADFLSRHSLEVWEICLDRSWFWRIQEHFGVFPTLDVFASRKTRQLTRYMSWEEDKMAVARDAMMAQWDPVSYMFPPVPLILKSLQIVETQGISALLICPAWTTTLWWQLVEKLLVDRPLSLPFYKKVVHTVGGHPVECFLDPLVAVHISGDSSVRQSLARTSTVRI